MLTDVHGALFLSVLFAATILSIIEGGLLIFIIKTHSKKDRKYFIYVFALTFLWSIYLILHNLEYDFYIDLELISHSIGIFTLVFFSFLMPKLLKFYNKYLLIAAGFIALIAVISDFAIHYGLPLQLVFLISLFIPPLLGYFLFMEAAIRKK